jgi:hypothetical protein
MLGRLRLPSLAGHPCARQSLAAVCSQAEPGNKLHYLHYELEQPVYFSTCLLVEYKAYRAADMRT